MSPGLDRPPRGWRYRSGQDAPGKGTARIRGRAIDSNAPVVDCCEILVAPVELYASSASRRSRKRRCGPCFVRARARS
jgi:hypothetical protein